MSGHSVVGYSAKVTMPMVSSGLRIGTPALATRGFGAVEFDEVADIVATTLVKEVTPTLVAELRERVTTLTSKFPLYEGVWA